jgi:hypothetical protein
MSKLGGVILILTGIGAAAYVMPRVNILQGDNSRNRPIVDIASIPPSAPNGLERTREPTQPAARNFATSPLVTATVADVAVRPPVTEPTAMPRPTAKAGNTVMAQATSDSELMVRKVSSTRPADSDMRFALTRDLQRELKRVGCYEGEVDGHWGTGSRMAMKTFTERVNATLPIDEPDYILLALVQGQKDKACGKCPPGQGFAENGRCLPSALLAQAAKRALSKRELSPSGNTRQLAERIKPATTTWTTTATAAAPATPAPAIEGRMGVGGPSADTPSTSNAAGGDDRGVSVAGVPPEGTQGEDPSRAGHSTHGPGLGHSFYGGFAAPRSIRPTFGPSFFAQRDSERK